MGEFGAGEEFGCKLGCVLAAIYTTSASAVAWSAPVEIERAGVVFFLGSGVGAGHETEYPPA